MGEIADLKAKVKGTVCEELNAINERYESKYGVRPYDIVDVSFSFGDAGSLGFLPRDFSIVVEVKEKESWLLDIDVPSFYEIGQRLRKDFPACGMNVELRFLGGNLSESRGTFSLRL